MKVIFYSREMDETAASVSRVIENTGGDIDVEIYHSTDSLRKRIIRPLNDVVLALIRPSRPSDLENLSEMKERFEMLDIIIMASGQFSGVDRELQALRPRFVFNVDDNPDVIGLVLKKMMERKKADPSYRQLTEELEKNMGTAKRPEGEREKAMAKECEKLDSCGFFKKYNEVKSLTCKGFFRSYCLGILKDECIRKEYLEAHGEPPSDDMMPNGRYMPSCSEAKDYEHIK